MTAIECFLRPRSVPSPAQGGYAMARGSSAVILATIGVLASAALAQQVPATDSVADAAREQKALNSKQKKAAQKKVYTNSDVAQSDATPSMNDRQASPETSSSPAHAGARRSSLIADQPSMGKNPKHPDSGVERSPL